MEILGASFKVARCFSSRKNGRPRHNVRSRAEAPRYFGILLLTALSAHAAIISADATVHWTENVSRTSAANQKDAYGADVHGSARWGRQLARNLTAVWQVDGALHATPKYELREHARLGVGGDLKYKFGLGPTAPTLTASGKTAARVGRLDQADGFERTLTIRAEKRFNPSWRIGAQIGWVRHHADSATFDVGHREFSGDVSWDISDRWRLSHGHGRFEGNFTANAGPANWTQAIGGQVSPAVAQYYNSLPWEVTNLYGPGWVSYNVTGRARMWWVELAPALTERSSLALRYQRIAAKNIIDIEYEQTLWSLTLAHQF